MGTVLAISSHPAPQPATYFHQSRPANNEIFSSTFICFTSSGTDAVRNDLSILSLPVVMMCDAQIATAVQGERRYVYAADFGTSTGFMSGATERVYHGTESE